VSDRLARRRRRRANKENLQKFSVFRCYYEIYQQTIKPIIFTKHFKTDITTLSYLFNSKYSI